MKGETWLEKKVQSMIYHADAKLIFGSSRLKYMNNIYADGTKKN